MHCRWFYPNNRIRPQSTKSRKMHCTACFIYTVFGRLLDLVSNTLWWLSNRIISKATLHNEFIRNDFWINYCIFMIWATAAAAGDNVRCLVVHFAYWNGVHVQVNYSDKTRKTFINPHYSQKSFSQIVPNMFAENPSIANGNRTMFSATAYRSMAVGGFSLGQNHHNSGHSDDRHYHHHHHHIIHICIASAFMFGICVS